MLAGVLSGLVIAIAVAALAANYIVTVRSYPGLPDSVPYHFDGYGNPDIFGPRPVIFIGPIAQLIAFAIVIALIANASGNIASICIVGGILDFVLIYGYFSQRGILNVALGKCEAMHPYAFWRN